MFVHPDVHTEEGRLTHKDVDDQKVWAVYQDCNDFKQDFLIYLCY